MATLVTSSVPAQCVSNSTPQHSTPQHFLGGNAQTQTGIDSKGFGPAQIHSFDSSRCVYKFDPDPALCKFSAETDQSDLTARSPSSVERESSAAPRAREESAVRPQRAWGSPNTAGRDEAGPIAPQALGSAAQSEREAKNPSDILLEAGASGGEQVSVMVTMSRKALAELLEQHGLVVQISTKGSCALGRGKEGGRMHLCGLCYVVTSYDDVNQVGAALCPENSFLLTTPEEFRRSMRVRFPRACRLMHIEARTTDVLH
jgi:hypothetical protein